MNPGQKGCRGNPLRRVCCVPACNTRFSKNSQVPFHSFPTNTRLRKIWIHNLRIGKKLPNQARVCGLHFSPTKYNETHTGTRKRLHSKAVPSRNLPQSSVLSKSHTSRIRLPRMSATDSVQNKNIEELHDSVDHSEDIDQPLQLKNNILDFLIAAVESIIEHENVDQSNDNIHPSDNNIQTSSKNNMDLLIAAIEIKSDENSTLSKTSLENNSNHLINTSGSESLHHTNILCDDHFSCNTTPDNNNQSVLENNVSLLKDSNALVSSIISQTKDLKDTQTEPKVADKCHQTDNFDQQLAVTLFDLLRKDEHFKYFSGISSPVQFDELVALIEKIVILKSHKPRFKLSLRDMSLLFLSKLKLNDPFVCLGALFNISHTTASLYFEYMVDVFYLCLYNAVPWLPQDIVRNTVSYPFASYPRTRIVLDCTELKVQVPDCVSCRIRTYSHYKGHHTIKFLIGIAPSGLITFVSNAYGGKASDSFIIKDCQILQKLEPTDQVMVDRGFLIDKDCAELGIELIRPPFLQNKKQLSESDAIKNSKIASARVHIERVIQRIKSFKIMQGTIPMHILPYIDKLLIIICGLVNLQNPIIHTERGKSKKAALNDKILCQEDIMKHL